MRIDGAVPLPENQPTSKVAGSEPSPQPRRTAPVNSGQDQAQLSANNATIMSLQAGVAQVPEIRQDRVDALRAAISSGTYQVSDRHLAEAIASNLSPGQLQSA